ncbi:hypothetical protein MES5069_480042 [Mesorhizobium escarrei]|uniref:Uncharacterized protein n=1 Tax=Mesorhizobium escarrei TaxID=666018 RepID=A0ABN8K5Y6_9HYPH|nr:hypothetical protein MES5069_480042 [Mesorhizobium escarrei]
MPISRSGRIGGETQSLPSISSDLPRGVPLDREAAAPPARVMRTLIGWTMKDRSWRFRPRHGVHLERDPRLVEGSSRRMALHRAGQADAERLCRILQRPDARCAVEREPILRPRSRPKRHRRMAYGRAANATSLAGCDVSVRLAVAPRGPVVTLREPTQEGVAGDDEPIVFIVEDDTSILASPPRSWHCAAARQWSWMARSWARLASPARTVKTTPRSRGPRERP